MCVCDYVLNTQSLRRCAAVRMPALRDSQTRVGGHEGHEEDVERTPWADGGGHRARFLPFCE